MTSLFPLQNKDLHTQLNVGPIISKFYLSLEANARHGHTRFTVSHIFGYPRHPREKWPKFGVSSGEYFTVLYPLNSFHVELATQRTLDLHSATNYLRKTLIFV